MTLEQRAQQAWSVLTFAAREQKVVSYSLLSQITEFPETASSVLHYIYCYCKQHHLPPLNVIVIDPATGRPGDECLRDVRDLPAQQSRVFLYDWLNYPVPSDEMFKEAMVREEELERADAEYLEAPCRC
jgi:hypothetical protein